MDVVCWWRLASELWQFALYLPFFIFVPLRAHIPFASLHDNGRARESPNECFSTPQVPLHDRRGHVHRRHVHEQLVLRPGRHGDRGSDLQVHRVQRVSAVRPAYEN